MNTKYFALLLLPMVSLEPQDHPELNTKSQWPELLACTDH